MPDAPSLEELTEEGRAAIAAAGSAAELEELRVRLLGRKAALTRIKRSIGELPAEQRGRAGREANAASATLEALLAERTASLEAEELDRRLVEDRVDVTLPGDPPSPRGSLHLITETRREIEDIFVGLGFRVLEGPEIEFDYYNFTALNVPPGHPARMLQDTFYLAEGATAVAGEAPPASTDVLLRTHTSPMQVRAMEAKAPPIYVIVPGKAYRRDSDATHTPMFHQVEGLAIDEDITLADLQGVLLEFARTMFGAARELRLRPDYFPFTEPSVQVDISCFACGGTGRRSDGSRDPLCKGSGWIEILGAGMVDPNVLGFVADRGYDPERVQGFAFGLGIERIAMLRHGVPDLRLLYDNDLRFLAQFGR
jgi:phenylalanyl-tRNA synthetase alpha chain